MSNYNKIQELKEAIAVAYDKNVGQRVIKELKSQLADAEREYDEVVKSRSPQEAARCQAWSDFYATGDDKFKQKALRIQDEMKIAREEKEAREDAQREAQKQVVSIEQYHEINDKIQALQTEMDKISVGKVKERFAVSMKINDLEKIKKNMVFA